MNSPTRQQASTTDLTRDELEKQKLRLEIKVLDRPWWKNPAHSLYTLLTICSLSIVFLTGSYQANSSRLDTEKAILAQDNKDLELKRDPLHKDLDQATRDRDYYRAQLTDTAQQMESAKQELATAKQQLEFAKMQQTLKSAERSLSTLALSNARFSQSLDALVNKVPSKAVLATKNSSIAKLHFTSSQTLLTGLDKAYLVRSTPRTVNFSSGLSPLGRSLLERKSLPKKLGVYQRSGE